MNQAENLVYIPLPIAKLLAEKDQRIEELETENYYLKEKLELAEQEPIKDIYDYYGVNERDF